jgi:hypothetical protein
MYKAVGQGCRARLPGKAAGQGCRARLHAMVQYAESMVKLDNNAVFLLMCPQQEQQEQQQYKKNLDPRYTK